MESSLVRRAGARVSVGVASDDLLDLVLCKSLTFQAAGRIAGILQAHLHERTFTLAGQLPPIDIILRCFTRVSARVGSTDVICSLRHRATLTRIWPRDYVRSEQVWSVGGKGVLHSLHLHPYFRLKYRGCCHVMQERNMSTRNQISGHYTRDYYTSTPDLTQLYDISTSTV